MNQKDKKVYIIILNYNGWKDTINCLEGVLRNDYSNYSVVVVDNNSTDNSMEYLIDWAEGKTYPTTVNDLFLKELVTPPIQKPIQYNILKWKNIQFQKKFKNKTQLTFLQSENNGGYAAGNNIGIQYALLANDFEYIWILNNDTIIKKNTLSELINRVLSLSKFNVKTGVIGSAIIKFNNTNILQSVGGGKIVGLIPKVYAFERKSPIKVLKIYYNIDEKRYDFVTGASFLILKNVIKSIGLLDESYFMYAEETDYCLTAKAAGFIVDVAPESHVYHKGASTTGGHRSNFVDYYLTRNYVFLYQKFYPSFYLFPIFKMFLTKILVRLFQRNFINMKFILFAFKDGMKKKSGPASYPF